jgi:hypothetical protein
VTEQPTGTVTLLFSDIEGSTVLLQRLGTQRYAAALDLHRQVMREDTRGVDTWQQAWRLRAACVPRHGSTRKRPWPRGAETQ